MVPILNSFSINRLELRVAEPLTAAGEHAPVMAVDDPECAARIRARQVSQLRFH